jgi:hypothetical protein
LPVGLIGEYRQAVATPSAKTTVELAITTSPQAAAFR